MKTKNLHLFRAFFTLSLLLHILSSPSFAQEAPPKTLGGCICQGENVEICLGEEVVIGCEAPIQPCESYCYKWTPAEDAISNGTSEDLVAEAQLLVSPEETTTYILTISDEAGEIVAEESYTVTVLGVRASIFPSSPLICPTIGNIVELTAFPNEGDFSYEWASTPAGPTAFPTTATIQVDVPAVYTVSVTDNETGCISVEDYKLIDDSDPGSSQAIKNFFKDRGFLEVEIEITDEIFGIRDDTGVTRDPEYLHVRDLANRLVLFVQTDVNIPEYLDDFLTDDGLVGLDKHGYITSNDNFCTENALGTSSVIEEIDQQYQSREYAYWIHLWENPDDGGDCLFIQCITPTHENPMPESSAIADNILAFQGTVQNRTEIYGYASKDQQLFDILINDLMDFCDGDLFDGLEMLYNDPDGSNGVTDPDTEFCTGLVSEQDRYCINVAGWPITVPDKSLLLYEYATVGTSSQPYLTQGRNYYFDSRSLIGFMGIDGIPWRSYGNPRTGQHIGFKHRDNKKGEPFIFPAISNYECDTNPRTYFGSKGQVDGCTHYYLNEYHYRSSVQDGGTQVSEIPAGARMGPPVQDLEESGDFCDGLPETIPPLSSTTSQSCIPHITQSQIDLALEDAQLNPYGHRGFVFKMQMHLASDPPGVTFWRIIYARHDAILPEAANHFTYYVWDCAQGGWTLMPDDWVIQEEQVEFIFALLGAVGEGFVSLYNVVTSSPHGAYDYAGMIPVIGTPADLANTGWYLIEGEFGEAAWSAIGLIPILGDAVQWVRVGTKVHLRVGTKIYRVAFYGAKNLDKSLPLKRVMDRATELFPDASDEVINELFKKYTRFLIESPIGNRTAKLLEDHPELLRTFKAAEDEGLSLSQKEALFGDLLENSNNAIDLRAAFIENADLVKAWDGLFNTGLSADVTWLTRASKWIEEGAEIVNDTGTSVLIRKNGEQLGKIVEGELLPTKYVAGGTRIDDAGSGYDFYKLLNGEIGFRARFVVETEDEFGFVFVNLENGTQVGRGSRNNDNLLELEIDVKPDGVKIAKGENVFNSIFDNVALTGPIEGVKAEWGLFLPDNLDTFNHLILTQVNIGNMTLEQAALQTFTGRMSESRGFASVVSDDIIGTPNSDGTYDFVTIIFR